jgi:hypothetical protein
MSSFGTKKPGADLAQQLTFPHIFSEAVAPGHIGYYPEAPVQNEVVYPYNNLQGTYHQQKMEDAHRRALNGVADTMRSKERFLHSHAGYYNMPKAVLGQRKFANPSNGNQADIYNNRNVSFEMPPTVWSSYRPEGLSGGVLYTAEAQKWGRQKLRERIPQLDAINAEREAFVNGLPVQGTVGQTDPEGIEGSKVKLELVATLRAILSSVSAGKADAIAWSDTLKFMRLFFRYTPSASEEELKEFLDYFDEIEEALLGIQEVGDDGRDADDLFNNRIAPNVDIMLEDFQKLREYLTKMMEMPTQGYVIRKLPNGRQEVVETQGTQNMTTKTLKERKALSANLIKSIGFTTLKKAPNVEQQARMVRDVERGDRIRDARGGDGGDDDDSSPAFSDRWLGNVDNLSQSSMSNTSSERRPFNRPPFNAVAEQMRRYYGSVGFDPNPRENIGRKNGSFFGVESSLLRNPFREGNGEDQAQGLEVSEERSQEGSDEEEEEEEEMGARSRSSRGSRGAEADEKAELTDAELRERLGAPAPALPAPRPVAPRPLADIMRERQQLFATMTPDMVRERGRSILPQDPVRLKALAERWESQGLGKGGRNGRGYIPNSTATTRRSMLNQIFTSYSI